MKAYSTIAIDFDGVIAETGPAKVAWIWRNVGVDVNASPTYRSALVEAIGTTRYETMQAEIGRFDTLQAPPVEEAIEALEEILRRHRILVLTSRPSDKRRWVLTWLGVHLAGKPAVEVLCSGIESKLALAVRRGCSCLIDNDLRHLVEPTSKIAKIWFCGLNPDRAMAEQAAVRGVELATNWRALKGRFSRPNSMASP